LLFEYNRKIPLVRNAFGATGVDLQEDTFPGIGVSDKKVHCSSGKIFIITDESQQNLRFFIGKVLSEKRE